jgi:hypothetical protein
MGTILNVYNIYQKYMDGLVQHLEPRSCVGNDNVVIRPQLRCVNRKKVETSLRKDGPKF